MKTSKILIAMAVLTLMTAGCKKEEYASHAEYGRVVCTTSNPHVGDTVVLMAEVLNWGDCINSATYTWTVKSPDGNTSITEKVYRKSGDKSLYEAPSVKWVFKTSGLHKLSMSASFRYTMGDANSVMHGSANAKDGSVRVSPK